MMLYDIWRLCNLHLNILCRCNHIYKDMPELVCCVYYIYMFEYKTADFIPSSDWPVITHPTSSAVASGVLLSNLQIAPLCWRFSDQPRQWEEDRLGDWEIGINKVGSVGLFGGFLKWWYPTTMGFPTKNDHFGVFWGYHHLRKHPFGDWCFF